MELRAVNDHDHVLEDWMTDQTNSHLHAARLILAGYVISDSEVIMRLLNLEVIGRR